jgi:hypothetical protein
VFDWSFWKGFVSGAALTALAFLRGVAAIKALWPNRAKPQVLDTQKCFIDISPAVVTVKFELLVNNAGSKDCSVVLVELMLPNGRFANLDRESSTTLPKTIAAGQTERITMWGWCGKPQELNLRPLSKERLALQPPQNSVEGTVVVKFNTKKIIKKKTIFTATPRLP